MGWAKFQEDVLELQNDTAFDSRTPHPQSKSFLSKVVAPQHYRNGYVKYNPVKKRVEIYVEGEIPCDARKELKKWNYHPQKDFWSKGCSSKRKIKMYFSFASNILE